MIANHNSIQHLDVFLSKLIKKEPFAVIRPGDGEYFIMINHHFNTQDVWSFNGGSLQQDLLSVKDLIKGLHDIYIGIPCKACQGEERVSWYKNTWELNEEQITYANIFCNKNWKPFTNYLIESKHPLYYIGPGQNSNNLLHIVDSFIVDSLLVNSWDIKRNLFLVELYSWVDSIATKNSFSTFAFSLGPISKYVIPILYKKYPNNQFLDVGSAFDYYMKSSSNRGYILPNDTYSNVVCDFKLGHI